MNTSPLGGHTVGALPSMVAAGAGGNWEPWLGQSSLPAAQRAGAEP